MQNPVQSVNLQSDKQESKKSITLEDLEIKDLGDNTYDVFVGKGWSNWSRFVRNGRTLRLVSGAPVDNHIYNLLLRAI